MSDCIELRFTPRFVAGRMVTAICDELAVAASGESESEAAARLADTVRSFVRALVRGCGAGDYRRLDATGINWRLAAEPSATDADGELLVRVPLAAGRE